MSKQGLDNCERSVPELKGAQATIRDAFFGHDAGLFVLDCNPGSGKSTVSEQLAAEAVARAWNDGTQTPAQTLCVASFAREDAAAIVPGVSAALSALATDPDSRVDLAEDDVRTLSRRLRESETLGTIDSILHGVFEMIAPEVGFGESPAVGDESLLTDVHAACVETLHDDGELADVYTRLDDAYPGGRYKMGADGLLSSALRACRERRLSVDAFRESLVETANETYPDGPPSDFGDVLADIRRFVGKDAALDTARSYDPTERPAVVDADETLYVSWLDAIDDFCMLLEAYTETYDELAQDVGVASHLDTAHWVARFFEDDTYRGAFRTRLQSRYTDRFSTVIVDEAQDVSVVQHDALAHFVDTQTRVLVVGDSKQSIYTWRNAHPQLFERAIRDGTYFGIDWDTHVVKTAARSYRCRPDIAATIDTVFEPVFADSTRGGAGDVDISYPRLVADRDPTEETEVHVAAFDPQARPGTKQWVSPRTGTGEADALAKCLAAGFEAGHFETDENESPSVTVLFPRRTYMEHYERACEAVGLSILNASQPLFDHPLVNVVKDVCQWLVDPTDPERTKTLLTNSSLADFNLTEAYMKADQIDTVHDVLASGTYGEPTTSTLRGLCVLADHRPHLQASSGSEMVEEVLSLLSLWRDPHGHSSDDSSRRVTTLDALLEAISRWESSGDYPLERLAAALKHYCNNPKSGPSQPASETGDHDVVFKTIHQMKGGEADVVALADIGANMSVFGPYNDDFVARGPHLALAPPADTSAEKTAQFAGLDHGLYTSSPTTDERDAGLRWATEHWHDDGRLSGPPALSQAAGDHRAERWRLLYVALTRARDHLVVPLPTQLSPSRPRERWVDTIRDALGFDSSRRDTYAVTAPDGHSFSVRVHHPQSVSLSSDMAPSNAYEPFVTTESSVVPPSWSPRFVNPSTLYPLTTDADKYVLDHLQGRSLHTDHDGVAEGVPLSFESMGPEVVGHVTHGVLTEAVRRGVSTETLQSCGGPLEALLEEQIRTEAVGVTNSDREQLRSYVSEVLCPQFAETDLWSRLRDATVLYVEESLDTVIRVTDADVEIQSHADFVSKSADGTWHVDDLKVSLQSPTEETSARYSVQAETYGWILSQQVSGVVESGVTRIGVEPAGWCSEVSPQVVLEHLRTLR
ncbi:UvrD-helicase domain-containing protein [Haloferax larsenii]|uniref:ATP-dependent helicase/nuclease subunit A n=1 Tax=Haloferax larsenii TaxID=302484 RepID=A0A1H7V534_HALLR|nr:UvrD-helicase domain-containing protein [Haloferax larsenii]SEM04306.1 ATP-dependent helicase/nuclease subunit A [Haloferax larsenii]